MVNLVLGQLKEVDVKEVWPSEPQNFTPWLAKNLPLLEAALKLDLRVLQQEAPVGPFFLDILATDEGGVMVVIENQLESTDHRHLGQLLTYAAGYDARTLIWITPNFRDEHRAALDWLNRWTSNEIKVYGVEVRVVRIGDSLRAPEFIPVVFPNEWFKSERTKVNPGRGQTTRVLPATGGQATGSRLHRQTEGYILLDTEVSIRGAGCHLQRGYRYQS